MQKSRLPISTLACALFAHGGAGHACGQEAWPAGFSLEQMSNIVVKSVATKGTP
jgi:hypothetical protein